MSKEIEFIGQGKLDEVLYRRYFKGVRRGFYIECGALDGVRISNTKVLEDHFNWTGILIEPNFHTFKKLKENRPNNINLKLALSDRDGEGEFTLPVLKNRHHGRGSTNYAPEIFKRIKRMSHGMEKYSVKFMTYKTLIDITGTKKVDLFILDVEGAELDIISGMKGCKVLPKVFCVEFSNNELKEGIIKKVTEELNSPYYLEHEYGHDLIFCKKRKANK
jgi:FkbM family methyltransferase